MRKQQKCIACRGFAKYVNRLQVTLTFFNFVKDCSKTKSFVITDLPSKHCIISKLPFSFLQYQIRK